MSSQSEAEASESGPGTTAQEQTSSLWSWGAWAQDIAQKALEQAKDPAVMDYLAEQAKVIGAKAQETASELGKRATELHQDLDLAGATSTLLGIGLNHGLASELEKSQAKAENRSTNILDLSYITENVIAMAMPLEPEVARRDGGNDIRAVAAFLKRRHQGHFMVWNVSEESYNYSMFADQVIEYRFPGHPAPPLGLMFKICTSIESWLDADEKNVAIAHCLTGKGRTGALLACVLTWIGEFSSPMEALQYIADRKRISVDYLTIPSQQRYVQYFSNMLDGVKPRSEHLLLRRVIMTSIPSFGSNGTEVGCCPYIQLFKNGKLISTAVPTTNSESVGTDDVEGADKVALKFVASSEGSVSFSVDCPVNGDVLLRCRHADPSGARHSMFRAAFHTGYVPCGVLRLTKVQLDGANTDPRFDEDFFVDLIFAPIEAGTSNLSSDESSGQGQPSDSGLVIDSDMAEQYEQSLHRDAKFWDAVTNRKNKARKRRSRKFVSSSEGQFSILDEPIPNSESACESRDLPQSPVTSKSRDSTGMSDLDLIMLLGEAEEDGSLISNTNSVSMGADSSPVTPAKMPANVVTPSNLQTADKELQALEDLEKELGLDGMNLFSTGNTSAAASVAVTPVPNSTPADSAKTQSTQIKDIAELDDLDDIEEYLNSLNS